MLNSLIKKQFAEIFESYFVNQKTGKSRSKAGTIGFFILFLFIMACLGSFYFGMCAMLSDILKISGYEWLFFALMDIIALLFGLFGSVFNAFSSLYLAKDNEILLSMPIPIKYLLVSRLTGVVGLSLIYSSVVMIPTTVAYLIYAKFDLLSLVFQILLIPILAFFISVLSCALGFVIAVISSRLKNKSFITVVISLAFIAVYYFFCFKMSDIFKSIVANSESIGNKMKIWGNLLYQLGKASTGDVLSFLIFFVITAVLCVLCFAVLSKTFIKLATANRGEKKVAYKKSTEKKQSISSAVFYKELKRFTSSATYMLNCGLGVIMLPIMGVAVIIKRQMLLEFLVKLKVQLPEWYALVPIVIAVIICVVASVGNITVPSVSLEGKNLWIYKSLPIDTYLILKTKVKLHIYITSIPVIISSVLICLAIGYEYYLIVLIAVLAFVFVSFSANLGLILGLLKPNLNWVSETTPIKQSMPVFINMLVGIAVPALLMAAGYFTRDLVTVDNFLVFAIVVFTLITRFLDKFIRTKGVEIFENL